jgi:1A family penicillin-binding protein
MGAGKPGAAVTGRFYVAVTLNVGMSWRETARGAWSRVAGAGGTSARAAGRLRALAAPPGVPRLAVALRLLLAAWAIAGAIGLYWTSRHALAIRRLTRGVGDTVFFGADGRRWFSLDENRRDAAIADISPHLRAAVVAVEDHRFYRHRGIDPLGIARAAARNLTRSSTEGGSTLTQQLARTLFLSNDRTYMRKAKEAALALMIEQQLGKEQVLEMYLNRVYFGAGTYGAEAMSRRLFGKPAKRLTLAEAAMLAGLPQAPSALSPWTNYDGARARANVVLARMRDERAITPEAAKAAMAARVRITPSPGTGNARNGYAKDFLRQQFRERVGNDHPPDWEVHTTFLPGVQEAAERALVSGLARLGKGVQGAIVALDPETGDILALVGGRDFNASPFNRAVRSRRQPGSAFKPFVYAVALERGMSPVSVLSDLHSVSAPGRQEWTPRNSGDDSPETATLREALLESNNQAAVALQVKVGTGSVRSLAAEAGLRDMPDVPSLALGSGLVTPLDLTAAYAAFPNGGNAVKPRAIVRVLDADGSIAVRNHVESRRVLSREAAFQVVSMLEDVVEVGTASSVRSLGVRIPVAGKTGTTNEFKDAWFVGFSTSVVAGVWVGYDQPQPIGEDAYAARVALPIWADFMRRTAGVLKAEPFQPPPGLEEKTLCRISYLQPLDGCPVYTEYFKEGDAVPRQMCPIHSGSLRQEAKRVIGDALRGLGRRLLDLLR